MTISIEPEKESVGLLPYVVSFISVIGIALVVSGSLAITAPQPLSYEDKFMKAQFCVQTNRLPVMYETKVLCLSRTGVEEEVP